jgi:hypothetical protein
LAFHRKRIKLEFEKKQRLPEPRRTKHDEFEELTGKAETTGSDDPLKDARDILKGPSTKGFGGLRRSKDPYEKQKETAREEAELKSPTYGTEKPRRRRAAKRG